MITFSQKGDFRNLSSFLEKSKERLKISCLDKYGREGVAALQRATPIDTGETASSWYYKIERDMNTVRLIWCNSNINEGVPIAVIIQYGHAMPSGSYVEGVDYINPALKPVFERLADDAWKEVSGK